MMTSSVCSSGVCWTFCYLLPARAAALSSQTLIPCFDVPSRPTAKNCKPWCLCSVSSLHFLLVMTKRVLVLQSSTLGLARAVF